jgi:hypothetical protein
MRDRHFAHVSSDDPKKLAYTPDDRHGREDRQVRTRPGKYLTRYFSDVLSAEEIRDIATVWAAKAEDIHLRFATTQDDCATVYENGPSSCMGPGHSFNTPVWPTAVYGAGDLAVAYLGSLENASARAVVWPDRKVWCSATLYGDDVRLEEALQTAGYSRGSIAGAKLAKIDGRDGRVVMPYLGDYGAIDCGDHLELTGDRADYGTGSTNGWSEPSQRCGRCDDGVSHDDDCSREIDGETWCEYCVDNHTMYCESCEEYHSDQSDSYQVDGETWCDDCRRCNATYCDHCEEYTRDDNVVGVGRESWCLSCYENDSFTCERCEEFFDCNESASIEGIDETWCADCASDYAAGCDGCGDTFRLEDMTGGACDACVEERAAEERERAERDGQTPLPIIASVSERSGGIAYI